MFFLCQNIQSFQYKLLNFSCFSPHLLKTKSIYLEFIFLAQPTRPHNLNYHPIKMSLISSSIRLLRLLPVLSSIITLMFARWAHLSGYLDASLLPRPPKCPSPSLVLQLGSERTLSYPARLSHQLHTRPTQTSYFSGSALDRWVWEVVLAWTNVQRRI
jgi:hypothetical protein